MVVARPRISRSRLWCLGSRCCTNTMARPVSAGKSASRCLKTSIPPADPPMPATGMLVVPLAAGLDILSDSSGAAWSIISIQILAYPVGKPWDRQPVSGKRRRKLGVSPGFAASDSSELRPIRPSFARMHKAEPYATLFPVFLRYRCQRGQLAGLQFLIQSGKLGFGQRGEFADHVLQLAGQSAGAGELRFGGTPFVVANVAVDPRHKLAQALFTCNCAAFLGGDNLAANHIGRVGEFGQFAREGVVPGSFVARSRAPSRTPRMASTAQLM